jgi:hypothetical protein
MSLSGRCILVVRGKRHLGAVLNLLPSKPILEKGVQIAETPAAVNVALDGSVVLNGGDDDQLIEMDGTTHAIVIGPGPTTPGGGAKPQTVVLVYFKPEAEVPTAEVKREGRGGAKGKSAAQGPRKR